MWLRNQQYEYQQKMLANRLNRVKLIDIEKQKQQEEQRQKEQNEQDAQLEKKQEEDKEDKEDKVRQKEDRMRQKHEELQERIKKREEEHKERIKKEEERLDKKRQEEQALQERVQKQRQEEQALQERLLNQRQEDQVLQERLLKQRQEDQALQERLLKQRWEDQALQERLQKQREEEQALHKRLFNIRQETEEAEKKKLELQEEEKEEEEQPVKSMYNFVIVTSKLIESIAIQLSQLLKKLHYATRITYMLEDEDINMSKEQCQYTKYIIIYNVRADGQLPPEYILYQVEQLGHFENDKRQSMLENAECVWDFSLKSIETYIGPKVPLSKVFYFPMPFVISFKLQYDIFFYGAENTRRRNILNELSNKYKVKVGFGIHGAERNSLIQESKLVLNLHYYDNPALETCRLNEILKYNTPIISESVQNDDYNLNLYKECGVKFVDCIADDLSNLNVLCEAIDKILWAASSFEQKQNLTAKSMYFLQRNLLQIIPPTKIEIDYNFRNNRNIHVLTLPETNNIRYDAFLKQPYYHEMSPILEVYPAIKVTPSWKGCAFSYLNLMYNAKISGLERITVCEDDCSFPIGLRETYNTVHEFLDTLEPNSWDIFVGIVADLPEDTVIQKIHRFKGMTFLEINKMHSMVFNIYNKCSYDKLLQYDLNPDQNNQIDQFIKNNNFKIVIPYPFIVSCLNVISSISNQNLFDIYNIMFKYSCEILDAKIVEFESAAAIAAENAEKEAAAAAAAENAEKEAAAAAAAAAAAENAEKEAAAAAAAAAAENAEKEAAAAVAAAAAENAEKEAAAAAEKEAAAAAENAENAEKEAAAAENAEKEAAAAENAEKEAVAAVIAAENAEKEADAAAAVIAAENAEKEAAAAVIAAENAEKEAAAAVIAAENAEKEAAAAVAERKAAAAAAVAERKAAAAALASSKKTTTNEVKHDKSKTSSKKTTTNENMMYEVKHNKSKTLVLFVFHIYNDLVKKFIKNSIFQDPYVDFVIIINDKKIIIKEVPPYVKVMKRDNVGFDFGGWSEALLTNNFYHQYDNFIFANSSITGPFMYPAFKGKWTDIYLGGLTGNVKLFGSTINTIKEPLKKSHVQSYIFSMDKETLQFLIQQQIFSCTNYAETFLDAVYQKEVLMSQKIIENGWNIGCLMKYYKGVDFTFKHKQPKDYPMAFLDDVMYSSDFEKVWTLPEIVFAKGNRNINLPPSA